MKSTPAPRQWIPFRLGKQLRLPAGWSKAGTLLVAAVISLLFAMTIYSQWDAFIRFHWGGRFGQSDPIFGRDIGFYVFQLPFYELLRNSLLVKRLADANRTDLDLVSFTATGDTSVLTSDLTTFAKSIAGGFPLAGVCGKAEYMDAIAPGGLGGTYAGHGGMGVNDRRRYWSTGCQSEPLSHFAADHHLRAVCRFKVVSLSNLNLLRPSGHTRSV